MDSRRIDFRLYLITDRMLFDNTRDSSLVTCKLLDAVEDALKAGIKAVQLREKDLPIRDLLVLAYRMRELTSRYNAKLFINDRVDVAMCAGADGVHLGQSGIPVHAVRKIVGKGLLIGASTHSIEEALTAEKEGADFITFGPVYATPSKLKYGQPVGISPLRDVSRRLSVPVFGIGGIRQDRVKEVLDTGAHGISVISGIFGGADVRGAALGFLASIKKGEEP